MEAIRRKIWVVIVLLIAAIAVSTVIYSRGGFSVASDNNVGFCGTVDPNISPITDANALKGENLFKANCTSCHTMDKDLTGPPLRGINDRVPYKNFIEDLLLYPKKTFQKSGYARALCEKYGDKAHMSFLNMLTKNDIKAIISYCKFCQLPQPGTVTIGY